MKRQFIAYFWVSSWRHLSLGAHISFEPGSENVEVHLPFGFLRIGFLPRHEGGAVITDSPTPNGWGWCKKGVGFFERDRKRMTWAEFKASQQAEQSAVEST